MSYKNNISIYKLDLTLDKIHKEINSKRKSPTIRHSTKKESKTPRKLPEKEKEKVKRLCEDCDFRRKCVNINGRWLCESCKDGELLI